MKHQVYQVFTYAALAAMLFGFIYFFTQGYGNTLNLDADVGAGLLLVLPGLFIMIVGTLFIVGVRGPFAVIGFGALAVGFTVLLQEMYDGAILVDSMLWGGTIAQIELIVIIFGLVGGGIMYAASKR
jgi:hypothetical protein